MPIDLKPGQWFFLKNLPPDTTAQEIADHFSSCGISLPVGNVSEVLDTGRGRDANGLTAIVSVDRDALFQLVSWAISTRRFKNSTMYIERFGTNRSAKKDDRF